jgi:hypothetical protein
LFKIFEQREHYEHFEHVNTMNTDFKYILQPYTNINSRITCPACLKPRQFTPYIDQETKERVSDKVGRCNRETSCGYHYTPKQYFQDNNVFKPYEKTYFIPSAIPPPEAIKTVSLGIPFEILKRSRKAYDQNNFAKFLIDKVGEKTALQMLSLYHLGTSKHWLGATVFWQIDIEGKVRAGKIMLYDKVTGHRIKKPFPHITWLHKLIQLKDYQLNQCLFGEHLLRVYPDKPTAIVESEKTAILAAAYLPAFNWLATGNLNNFNRERCQPLQGKTVLLFPDAGAYEIWHKKAKDLQNLATFIISDLIETNATPLQIEEGFDLADYLEGQPKTMFTGRKEFEQTPDIKIIKEAFISDNMQPLEEEFPSFEPLEIWPIEELEEFFFNTTIPEKSISLNNFSKISNPKKYIETYLSIIKTNNGNKTYKPYFERLQLLKDILSKNT